MGVLLNQKFFETPMSFESDLVVLWKQVTAMEKVVQDPEISKQLDTLKLELSRKAQELYSQLRPIDRVEVARHPNRPRSMAYINTLFDDFFEVAGDRRFGEDRAIMAGLAIFRGRKVILIAQEKGYDNDTRKLHNYGSPMPEGYRKAERVMRLAEELAIPIVSLVDTPGAYHGIAAEERGQAHALAECLATMSMVKVPVISCILGEGGSGGAIAIAAANRVLMLENAVYSVITPEGCAAILWQAKDKRVEAAEAQKLTASDLLQYGIIDKVIEEPFGGAHRDPAIAIRNLGNALEVTLAEYQDPTQYHQYSQKRLERYKHLHIA
jgi:acetyl-CoA carboxylase carboxyl transferase subunit alpha